MKRSFALFFLLIVPFCLVAQSADSTYAEKLGYPKNARVVILHVDDVGMSFDSNEGAINAITNGVANVVQRDDALSVGAGFRSLFERTS
jgi:hypothetical protein